MIDEYVMTPDVFDPAAYSNSAAIEICLSHLKEPLLKEALVRDLREGGWSKFCMNNLSSQHRLCKEILKKLHQNNRLRRFPKDNGTDPTSSKEWCQEALLSTKADAPTGIITSHLTKQLFSDREVSSIEKLTGTTWWQNRSSSMTIDRKTTEYLEALRLILSQANSLMFVDPNLDPSSWSYREFFQLLEPLGRRLMKPRVEIHRSLALGDGAARIFPVLSEWKEKFKVLEQNLQIIGLEVEVFIWDDFHPRYLITDLLGILCEAGFDVAGKKDELTTWARLGRTDKDKIQKLYDPAYRRPKFRFRLGPLRNGG